MTKLDDLLAGMLERLTRLEKQVRSSTRDSAGAYWVTLSPWTGLPPYVVTTISHLITIPRDGTLRKLALSTYTATTNNAGNHWTITLSDGAGSTLIAATTLEADTPDTWFRHEFTTFNISAMTATAVYIAVTGTKVGAPGALYIGSPTLYFS